MKKLTVIAAAIAMACVANAASCQWGFAGYEYYDHNGEELTTGSAFLYLGTVSATDSAFDLGSATLLASSSFDDVEWIYGSLTNVDLPGLADTSAGKAYTLILTETGVSSLDAYEGYYTLTTGVSTEDTIPGASNEKYANLLNYDPVTTSSLMQSVPEPTSGLLLLLGMAGLALKRKNA